MINLGHDIIKFFKNGKINHITLQVLYNIRGDFLNLDGEIVANEVADRIIKDYVNAIGELVENLEKLL